MKSQIMVNTVNLLGQILIALFLDTLNLSVFYYVME